MRTDAVAQLQLDNHFAFIKPAIVLYAKHLTAAAFRLSKAE